jgi:CheY-like chemotaxis protein
MFEKILCVDDDPITLMLYKKVISNANFSKAIDSAQNGKQALNYFDNLKSDKENNLETSIPQIVFLDLNMPILSGWEFLDIFTNNDYASVFPDTKVIVMSSTIDPKDIEKSKSYPMVIDFLSKPITKEMLNSIKPS